jgi:hypothetical protein
VIDRQTLLLLIIGLCIVNGIFSPYLKIAIPISAALLPELFPRTVEWVLFWGSILLSSATLLVSGVPAALYERFIDGDGKSEVSMWIWLAGAALLSVPSIYRLT